AGKTSLLESIHVLARGRSFRARDLKQAIQTGCERFEIVAKLASGASRSLTVGVAQSQDKFVARVDGRPVGKLSELAARLPIQWIGGNVHRLVEDGPAARRRFLDWGMFHVKPEFIPVWQRYQRLLKQRNAALRRRCPVAEIEAWGGDLARAGSEIDRLRAWYVGALAPLVETLGSALLSGTGPVGLDYKRGWRSERTLSEALSSTLALDREQGFTRSGPHRADLAFTVGGAALSDQLSRGQQKLLVVTLQISQARLLRDCAARPSVFLLDDFAAELDEANQERVLALLSEMEAQVFATAIGLPSSTALNASRGKRFHVKHGRLTEVL
ncbi:MAG: DNA replication/repair protein RecF, partial [Planctomycetes bacterium]|nr:DNA replication/repair protein RecF [Planctomycetota bacterium]